jgi:hypothetical protein
MLASMIHLWATIRGISFPVTNSLSCSRKLGLFPDGVVVYQVTSVAVGSFSGIDVAKRPEKGITEETSVAGLQARTAYSHSMIKIATILTARLSHAIFQCNGLPRHLLGIAGLGLRFAHALSPNVG